MAPTSSQVTTSNRIRGQTCDYPILVDTAGSYEFDTETAGGYDSLCDYPLNTYYCFTVPAAGPNPKNIAEFSTCSGTTLDTRIGVYYSCDCDEPVRYCSFGGCPGLQSLARVSAAPGDQLLVVVASRDTVAGSGSVQMSSA